MEPWWWSAALVMLAALILVNLLLTLRLVRWMRSVQEANRLAGERELLPELTVADPAPPFAARNLQGRPVRLADFQGQGLLLVFVSPHCGPCRREMPELNSLAGTVRTHSDSDLVLVSDVSTAETYAWLGRIREEDGVDIQLPCLIPALGGESALSREYNPRGITPYFCSVSPEGTVQARGVVNDEGWKLTIAQLSGRPATGATRRRPLGRYS